MNYNSTKEYGKLVKELALLIASPDSIYDKASSLYEFNEVHFVLSRLAYRELYNNYKYPSKDEIITFVLDEYVLTDIVKTVFLTKLFRNDKVEIEFIKREIGDAYSFICHVQELLQIMSKTAHPDINDSTDSIGINDLIQKVIADSENKQKFSYAYNCMAAKEALQEITVQHTQSASQDNAKLKESYTSASKDIGTPEGKYDFCH